MWDIDMALVICRKRGKKDIKREREKEREKKETYAFRK